MLNSSFKPKRNPDQIYYGLNQTWPDSLQLEPSQGGFITFHSALWSQPNQPDSLKFEPEWST